MPSIAVRAEGVGKRYRIGSAAVRHESLREALAHAARAPLRNLSNLRRLSRFRSGEAEDVVWALRDVSFEVRQGEAVGIIGRNGAGKSTLLKVLSRITEPSAGRAEIRGRVGSLLEVGTGFHPELTGRENVYLNGSILGMDRGYIDRKFDEIVEFSGVERYVDTPVKRYSSGMYLRLAFSVAAHLEPEVLIVDEVLAVGDADFQKKCLGRMGEVSREGRTVLFVSHNMAAVRQLCASAILLRGGRVVHSGTAEEVVSAHLQSASNVRAPGGVNEHGLELAGISLRDERDSGETDSPVFHRDYLLELEIRAHRRFPDGVVVVEVRDEMDTLVSTMSTLEEGCDPLTWEGALRASFSLPRLSLFPGRYTTNVCVYRPNDWTRYLAAERAFSFEVQPAVVRDAAWPYQKHHGIVRISDSARLSLP